jgi:hypothetical protein
MYTVSKKIRTINEIHDDIRGKNNTFCNLKLTLFWVVAPCSLVEVYRRFKDACCLHYQGGAHRPDDGGSKHL